MGDTPVPVLDRSKLGSLRLLRRDPIALLEDAADLGDVVRVPMPRVELFVVNHPDLVWDVLATGNHDFHKSPALQNARRVLGDGLLTSEDEVHRRQRRLIQPIFHHERIDAYSEAVVDEAERASDRLADDATVDLHAEMARLTLAIVGRTLFATDVESAETRQVTAALHEILSQFGRQFSPWFPITERLPLPAARRFDRSVAVFDRMISSLITERRTSGLGDDLLSLLLAAQEDGEGMTDTQVRDEAVTLFLAGHETTSNALTWTWWLLGRHPDSEARVHAELEAIVGSRPPVIGDLPSLPYLRAVLSESLRLRPPAWAMGRQAMAPHELAGITLLAGSVVVVSPWLLHHDERWWPRAQAFEPERWLAPDPGRPRHAYLPFGGGPRMCIGEGFAWMEAGLVLATIAQRWRFSLEPAPPVELQPVITLRPRHGMPMRAHRRERG
jgi:cytochrome P450